MSDYFGDTDLSSNTYGPSAAYDISNTRLYTCPGTGDQTVDSMEMYTRRYSAFANIRLAVYSNASPAALQCQGAAEVAIDTTASWDGHVGAANISPNPTTLSGGTSYRFAITTDNQIYFYANNLGFTSLWKYSATDKTGGWDASLEIPSNNDYCTTTGWAMRVGVTAAGGISVTATETLSFAESLD